MEVRFKLTKYRVAIAALFVLAGVGLGNLLSPLVGSALATVGTVSNISDHSASAFFAKVSSDGKLAVGDGAGLAARTIARLCCARRTVALKRGNRH